MVVRRHAAKVDANQAEIVAALKAAGATVEVIGQPVDLLVGYRGEWILMEVKASHAEERRKTATRKRQEAFFERHPHGGRRCTVCTPQEAVYYIAFWCGGIQA